MLPRVTLRQNNINFSDLGTENSYNKICGFIWINLFFFFFFSDIVNINSQLRAGNW